MAITASDLDGILSGDPEALEVHLSLVARDVPVGTSSVRVHCHCLAVDANGRVQPTRLAEFMRYNVADYVIPRARLAEAKARDERFRSTEAVASLLEQAKNSFTDLANTGEGGEMLLFLFAERFLRLPHILCKMDLKTDARMHYHGADGVYAGVTDDGILKLYWGESKIYSDPISAIRQCLASLAPFILEQESEAAERERDLLLLSDKADLSDPTLTAALRKYFDKSSVLSRRVKYCGVALVGFDSACYSSGRSFLVGEDVANAALAEMDSWCGQISRRVGVEGLHDIEIQMICVPFPSVDSFRSAFLRAMGVDTE